MTNFFYDDDYSYDPVYSQWKIHSAYNNYETVISAKRHLEVQAMRQLEPFQFLHLHGSKNYQVTYNKLSDYCKTEFGVVVDPHEIYYIPKDATDEQVLSVIKILNVDFYQLAEFEEEAIFWKPVMNKDFWGKQFLSLNKGFLADGNLFEREYKGHAFFNSIAHAAIEIPKILHYWLGTYSRKGEISGLFGTIETLSDQPIELQQLLSGTSRVVYRQELGRIDIELYDFEQETQNYLTLLELLSVKPYYLLPISLEEAKTLGYRGKNWDGYIYDDENGGFQI